MKYVLILIILIASGFTAIEARAASIKDKYVANCVKFAQKVNPTLRPMPKLQKEACSCLCDKVKAIGADKEDLRTIMQYTREYDFTALPERPTYEQILQAHVDVHRDVIKTQEDLEVFVKGWMKCESTAGK